LKLIEFETDLAIREKISCHSVRFRDLILWIIDSKVTNSFKITFAPLLAGLEVNPFGGGSRTRRRAARECFAPI
jgi:hypothetical protein